MSRPLALILSSFLLCTAAVAQVSEIGVTAGVAYYIGDLNPTKQYPKGTSFGFGGLYRYNFDSRYAMRIQGLYSTLKASDVDSPDSLQRLRNLDFESKLFEASLLLEINFFDFRGSSKFKKNWTPYVFGGIAYFRANPRAKLNDTYYDLVTLGTEGQGTSTGGDPYKVDHMSFPFGAGIKLAMGKRVDFSLEWGLRRTNTDYIDDVSGTYFDNAQLAFENGPQAALLADRSLVPDKEFNTGRARGDSQTRDWYQYTGFIISVRLGSKFQECEYILNSFGKH